MKRKPILALVLSCAALGACSIKQIVVPVSMEPRSEICVIEHTATRASFLAEYQRLLAQKGFATRVIPSGSALNSCPVTTTYLARWSWDLTIYMSYAEIRVYRDGAEAGSAMYDARMGSARMAKFVDAETKMAELVGQLFPQ